jgi:hypothetical protein
MRLDPAAGPLSIAGLTAATVVLPDISLAMPNGLDSGPPAARWFNPPKRWKLEGAWLTCTADGASATESANKHSRPEDDRHSTA